MSKTLKPCAWCQSEVVPRKHEGRDQFAHRRFCQRGCYDAYRRANLSLRSLNPKLYHIWSAMVRRCTNPDSREWPNYGGRGIAVSEEWRDFATFLRDVSPRPEGSSLDRIDNNRGYSKANCRWATAAEQNRNRRDNIWVGDGADRMVLIDYCRARGLDYQRATGQIRRGRAINEVLAELEVRRGVTA